MLPEDRKKILETNLPEYKKISEAPTAGDLLARHGEDKVEAAIEAEREIWYKAINSVGQLFLVRNPITFERRWIEKGGRQYYTIFRSKPQKIDALSVPYKLGNTKKNKKYEERF